MSFPSPGAQVRAAVIEALGTWTAREQPELHAALSPARAWRLGSGNWPHWEGCPRAAGMSEQVMRSELEVLVSGQSGACCMSEKSRELRELGESPTSALRQIWPISTSLDELGALQCTDEIELAAAERLWHRIGIGLGQLNQRRGRRWMAAELSGTLREQVREAVLTQAHLELVAVANEESVGSGMARAVSRSGASDRLVNALAQSILGRTQSPMLALVARPAESGTGMLSVSIPHLLAQPVALLGEVELMSVDTRVVVHAGPHHGELLVLDHEWEGAPGRAGQEIALTMELLGVASFEQLRRESDRVGPARAIAAAAVGERSCSKR